MTRAEVMQELTDHIDKMCADMDKEHLDEMQTLRRKAADELAAMGLTMPRSLEQMFANGMATVRVKTMLFRAHCLARAEAALKAIDD